MLSVGVQTLHYYEREGLIPAPERSDSGYRLYSAELVERIAFIRKAQALGLPLAEIRDILSLTEQGTSPCGRVQALLAHKLAEVDARLRELTAFREELAALVDRSAAMCENDSQGRLCAIVEEAPRLPAAEVTVTPLARKRPPARRTGASDTR